MQLSHIYFSSLKIKPLLRQENKEHNYYTNIFECFVQGSMADLNIDWILEIKILHVFWIGVWKQRAQKQPSMFFQEAGQSNSSSFQFF